MFHLTVGEGDGSLLERSAGETQRDDVAARSKNALDSVPARDIPPLENESLVTMLPPQDVFDPPPPALQWMAFTRLPATADGIMGTGPIEDQRLLSHASFVRAVARALIHDESVVDDVVQDTWLAALAHPPGKAGSLRGWLATVARHAALLTRRREARRRTHEVRAARREASPSSVEGVARIETVRRLVEAMQGLTPRSQEALVLRYYEDLPPREIAQRLGITVHAAKGRLRRALEDLRGRLDAGHDGKPRGWIAGLAPLAATSRFLNPVSAARLAGKGVFVMSLQAKVGMAVTLLVAVFLLLWQLLLRPPAESTQSGPGAAPGEVAAVRSQEERHDPAARAASPGEALPPLEADRDLDLFGIVVDEAGAPIAGAEVCTTSRPWLRASILNPEGIREVVDGPRTRSREDGRFALRLTRGQEVELRASAPGFADAAVPQCQAGERVEIILTKGATLRIAARDENGAPVPGVRITFWRRNRSRPRGAAFDRRNLTTGDGGRLVLEHLAPGWVEVRVDHDHLRTRECEWKDLDATGWTELELPGWEALAGSPYSAIPDQKTLRVPTSGTAEIVFTFGEGRIVQGRVTDARTGDAIPGARVGDSWVMDRCVRTDANGRYELRGCDDNAEVNVTAEGYGRRSAWPSGDWIVDFALEPGHTATGRIVNAIGEPVAGALVSALAYAGGSSDMDARSTVAGEDGCFELTSLRADLPHALVVQKEGHGRTVLDFDPSFARDGCIALGDVPIAEARRIEGIVVTGDGAPVLDACVELVGGNDDRGRLRPGEPPAIDPVYPYGVRERRRTDDLGRFRFPDLAPGSYTITASTLDMPGVSRTVVLPADRDLLGVEIAFEHAGSLTVSVRDREDRPVPGADVTLEWIGRGRLSGRTDTDGRSRIRGIPREETTVFVTPRAKYLPPAPRSVIPRGQEEMFVVEEAPAIEGVVLAPEGGPLGHVEVRAVYSWGDTLAATDVTDAEGRFTIPCAERRAVDLELTGSRRAYPDSITNRSFENCPFRGGREGLTPPASGVVIQARRIEVDASLAIRVVDPSGAPVPEAQVWAFGGGLNNTEGPFAPNAKGLMQVRFADEDGVLVLDELTAEPVQIAAGPPLESDLSPETIQTQWTTVVPRGQEITLALRRGSLLIGVVVAPDGAPAPGAIVTAWHDEGRFWATADAAGRFRVAVPPDSSYRLVAQWQDGPPPDGRVLEGIIDDVLDTGEEIRIVLEP